MWSGSKAALIPRVIFIKVGDGGSKTSTRARISSAARTNVAWPPPAFAKAARIFVSLRVVPGLDRQPDQAAAPIVEMARCDLKRKSTRRFSAACVGATESRQIAASRGVGERYHIADRAPKPGRMFDVKPFTRAMPRQQLG